MTTQQPGTSSPRVVIIGAGPSGLAMARALQKKGIEAKGFEASHDVGGLWDITNPRSTVYESAHLISSRTTTEFTEFPMQSDVDYPGHQVLAEYFSDYADEYRLRDLYQFDTEVTSVQPAESGEGWTVRVVASGKEEDHLADHVVMANGTLATPNVPEFAGEFAGEIIHSCNYKSGKQLTGKRVLIIGAGNSGCDIAVDAVHHAQAVDMSVRRGYYFVPRYIFGKPTDTFNQGKPLPRPIKQFVDKRLLRMFTGDPADFGFPEPDYNIYESHPIVNTLILNHLGQGDLSIRADIERFDATTVHFKDGSGRDYDMIVLATGYTLDYPFVEREHLNWTGMAPELYLNIFPPQFNGLSVMGMVEASGLGWQGRYEQAELIAEYVAAKSAGNAGEFEQQVQREAWPDLTAGYKYLGLERMSYYVNKDAYRAAVKDELARFRGDKEGSAS